MLFFKNIAKSPSVGGEASSVGGGDSYGGWGLCPQTPEIPPYCTFLATRQVKLTASILKFISGVTYVDRLHLKLLN